VTTSPQKAINLSATPTLSFCGLLPRQLPFCAPSRFFRAGTIRHDAQMSGSEIFAVVAAVPPANPGLRSRLRRRRLVNFSLPFGSDLSLAGQERYGG
jgi:hypothetical protein